MVRDTPRKNTLRSGNSKETEDESGDDTESVEEEEKDKEERDRVRSSTLERNMENIEEKTRKIKLKNEDSTTANMDSMETERMLDRGEEECVNCATWMGIEEEMSTF